MKAILLRFGELFLKGNNRKEFEKLLKKDIKEKLRDFPHIFRETTGRYIISKYEAGDESSIVDKLRKVFGLTSFSLCDEVLASPDLIRVKVKALKISSKTFRVNVVRADKRFPITSPEFAAELGSVIISENPELKVNLQNPETIVTVDIRDNNSAYIYTDLVRGLGGLPLGSSGRALLLLSGGIDSPVAGFQMAKRGLKFDAVHFHSYPYTGLQAKEKVVSLAKTLKGYTGGFLLHIVSFTKIQEEINKKCSPEFMIAIMRRLMMRIAERLALKNRLGAVITGESLGQVASQTMAGLTSSNAVLKVLPAFRPLLGSDKEEIMELAKKIGTYETSILPYEDCCTVFLPRNPVINPKLRRVEFEEGKLDIEPLVEEAIIGEEIVRI